ncbi:MAG: secondary thiamine-phosphate synthase enzyme YjbQ [Oscillospiraceae bacterium]|jgi:secondary thiamine-phosphate synthase enzyme|nr:secondary thiamine-phosphate synthase enzyme YjbQ [Oscillospiraceae bacterium]MDY4191246.1 secondary thiamine-phosphate synthase enzyme YjbQ [Oscillospiraceae bacterium]
MVEMTSFEIISRKEFDLVRITDRVREFAENSGVKNGLVYVITNHTTTGVFVNESLECLEVDIEKFLGDLIPTVKDYAHNHFLPSYGATGNNCPGHLKSLVVGNHSVIPIKDGKMFGGAAQEIYFAEFDGIQLRKVQIVVMGE